MYRFEKISEDTYKLIGNKEFTFTRTIDLAKTLQSLDMETTIILADILAERGETFENTKLKIERKEGNKTIVDESNFDRVKEQARNIAMYNILDKIFKKLFGLGYLELITQIGLDTNNLPEIEKFVTDLTNVLVNGIKEQTPSE